jgi:CHAT domain-containing protein
MVFSEFVPRQLAVHYQLSLCENSYDMLRHSLRWSLLLSLAMAGSASFPVFAKPASLLTKSKSQSFIQEYKRLSTQISQLYEQGQYVKAIPLSERLLTLLKSVIGSEHPLVATSLINLANLYYKQGQYEKAELLYQRSLAILEALGKDYPDVATSLNNLALLYDSQGQYEKAEPLYQRSLAILEKALGKDHPDVATSLNNLALLYNSQGQYDKSEALYKRSLAIVEKVLGKEHPDVANSLNNLATLYVDQGQYEKAEPLYQRSLAIREKVLGKEHPDVAQSLNNLATLYVDQGQYEKAEPLHKRSLTILEKAFGKEHPDVATSLMNLATLYVNQGQYEKAEPLYQRSLTILEKAFGKEHPDVATSLMNLATLYVNQGQYEKAEPLYQRSLAIREKVLGKEHPLVATSLNNLAGLYWGKKNLLSALTFQSRALATEESFLTRELTVGSEERKRSILSTLQNSWEAAVSFNQQAVPNDPQATRLALTTTLQRKGRVLDALADNLATLRRNLTPDDQKLLDRLSDGRTRLANAYFAGLGKLTPEQYRAKLDALKQQNEQLEATLASRSSTFRAETQPITLEAVQKQLPADSVLVEFVRYRPFDPKATQDKQWGEARYAAYLLSASGDPTSVELGSAKTIDDLASQFRNAVKSPDVSVQTVQTLGHKLHGLLIAPLQSKLAKASRLLISPDAQLNLVPFGALVDEDNHYLVQKYALSYLTSGRDLLRLATTVQPSSNPVIVANPDFTKATVVTASAKESRRSADLRSLSFNPLPGTAGEAKAITPLLPSAQVLTGTAASETALKAVQAPRILHIATHGFFLPDQPQSLLSSNRGGGIVLFTSSKSLGGVEPVDSGENPLLRSGLALAGANLKPTGGDDGLLTALEVANLNLQGTEMVVLSACETGVGSVANGEGVYGLRRALVLAGSRTQVVSLWQVSDLGTQELMTGFYKQLQQGVGKEEALRKEQLQFISSGQYSHPFYWAAFLLNGDWH